MSNNVSDFISKLEKLNNEKVDVFIPSRNKTVKVKPLNIKQQKDLIASALDGIKGALNYNKTINQIILDNSGLSDLKIYDKLPFCISLRTQALGSKIRSSEDNIVDLEDTLKNIKNTPFKLTDKSTIKYENLKVSLKVPTLQEEISLISKCEDLFSDGSDVTKEAVGILYLFEIAKYITEVAIDDEIIDMSEIKIQEKIDLIENLPLSIYTELTKFAESLTSYEEQIITINDEQVSIDSSFFDSTISR
jgi:hypothetical protein